MIVAIAIVLVWAVTATVIAARTPTVSWRETDPKRLTAGQLLDFLRVARLQGVTKIDLGVSVEMDAPTQVELLAEQPPAVVELSEEEQRKQRIADAMKRDLWSAPG